jgi:hypothetical protein
MLYSTRLFCLAIAAFNSACASKIVPARPTELPPVKHSELTYELGKTDSAWVGSPLLGVKDYFKSRTGHPMLIADESFIWNEDCRGDKGKSYAVTGEIFHRGTDYAARSPQMALSRRPVCRAIARMQRSRPCGSTLSACLSVRDLRQKTESWKIDAAGNVDLAIVQPVLGAFVNRCEKLIRGDVQPV